jgi:competence protein ComEA
MTAQDPDRRLDELFDEPLAADADDLAAVLRARIPSLDRRWSLLAIAGVFALVVVAWRGCSAVTLQVPIRDAVVSVAPRDAASPQVLPDPSASRPSQGSPNRSRIRINLNSASLAQMDSLPGVGPVLAQRILSWRASHRGFGDVHELLEVKGIGPAKFKKIQALVRAG